MQIDFDPDRLQLTINSGQSLPKVKAFDQIDSDIFGKVTGETRFAGPLADLTAQHTWHVDPRTTV
jgi:hypothetical protein